LIASSFGRSLIEPIGQIVARTNETHIGDLPNNDANSLVFDDTTLFQVDKFSGWDRVEGGVRANIGAQYTFLSDGGASVSAMFGQSYHLAGTNSFATPEEALLMTAPYLNARPLTGIGSGLDTEQSDYVARVLIDTAGSLRVGSQARFDQSDFALNRLDVQATVASGPFAGSITYAYQKTPDIIYDLMKTALTDSDYEKYKPSRERQEIQTAASVRATENWRLYGSLRYDLVNSFVIGNTVGLGFDNDSFSASLSYIESYDVVTSAEDSLTRNVRDRTVYLRIGLRTLGDTKFKHGFGAQ
jgi:LPS-assembly protein